MILQATPVSNVLVEETSVEDTLTSYVCASVSFPRARLISAIAFTAMTPFRARLVMFAVVSALAVTLSVRINNAGSMQVRTLTDFVA